MVALVVLAMLWCMHAYKLALHKLGDVINMHQWQQNMDKSALNYKLQSDRVQPGKAHKSTAEQPGHI